MTKVFLRDYNGILQGVRKSSELEFVNDPRESDSIVLWQDVRGEMLEIVNINKSHFHKPLIIVQHGRQATRDYGAPENFKLLADKICVWGEDDYERMCSLGYKDKVVITGCPYLNRLKPKEVHTDRNIIFAPVRTMHEEPMNIILHLELKKLEITHVQNLLRSNYDKLVTEWNPNIFNPDAYGEKIPYQELVKNFRLIAKITPLHDRGLYLGAANLSEPLHASHIDNCVQLLQHADVVVSLEEGTFQTLVMAMDIPLIIVKGWRLTQFAGKDYSKDRVELQTPGTTHVELSELSEAIERELIEPGRLSAERKQVVEREFGKPDSDPDKNIVNVIKEIANG
jgi:hypothetical protein